MSHVYDSCYDIMFNHRQICMLNNDVNKNFSGKVYNITPYMEYHPGGEEELMRGAGIDGTQLFDEVWSEKLFENFQN